MAQRASAERHRRSLGQANLISGAPQQWRRKMARRPAPPSWLTMQSQAHPPAAGGQPLPLFEQHHAFLATLQPAIQLANPASQSYGSLGAPTAPPTQPPPW